MENAPREGTTVPPSGVISIKKRREFHRRTISGYKGGTVVPPEGTGVVLSYLLRYLRTS